MTRGEYDASDLSYMGIWGYSGGEVSDQSDVFLINRFTGYGNIFTIDLSTKNLPKNILLGFFSTSIETVGIKVVVQLYKKMPLNNLSFNYSGDRNKIEVTLQTSNSASPGTYWGIVNITTSDGGKQLLPMIYHVIMNVETGKNYDYTSLCTEPNDVLVAKYTGIVESLKSGSYQVDLEAGKVYRFTLTYSGVLTTPNMLIIDENQTLVAQGFETGSTQLSTWFKAEKTGNYTISLVNTDSSNTMKYTLTIVNEQSQYSIGLDNSTYPNFSFVEGYDWSWRAEVGEWRFFYLKTNDSSLVNVTVQWGNYATDAFLQVFHYNTGCILAKQTPNYKGEGLYEDKYLNSTSLLFPAKTNQLYVIAIRAPVLSGIIYPENYKIHVEVEKYVGPYISVDLEKGVIPYLTTLNYRLEIKSSLELKNVSYEIDNLDVNPVNETIEVVSSNYWIISGSIEIHSIVEGKHNFTVVAYDSSYGSAVTKQFYVDSSPPLLTNVLINGTKYNGYPLSLEKGSKAIYVSFTVEDATPKNISISLINNFNRSLAKTGIIKFSINKEEILESINITNAQSIYNKESGRWEIEFNISLEPNLLGEGFYMVNLYAFDYLELNTSIMQLPIFYIDSDAPKIVKFSMYEGEPPKTLLYTGGALNGDKVNYTVSLEEGKTYNVYLTWGNPQTDLDLYIYDPYGYYAAMSINYGYIPENVTFKAKIGGNYTIQIVRYLGPETNYNITVREIKKQQEIGAIGPNMEKVTLDFTIFEVELSSVELYVNSHKTTLSLGQANYTNLGYTRFIATINASLFDRTVNNVTIRGYDSHNREGGSTFQIFKDATPPNLQMEYSKYTKEPLNISITCWDNETSIKEITVYLDNATYTAIKGPIKGNSTNITINTTTLSEGKHILKISATDEALNVANETGIFYLDLTPPEIAIISHKNNTEIGENTIIMMSIQDNVKASVIRIYLNDTLYHVIWVSEGETLYQTAIDLKKFQGNIVLIQLLAFDQAGNAKSVKYIFTIDRNPPAIQIDAPEATMIKDFNISITINDSNFLEAHIYIDGGLVETLENGTTTIINIKVKQFGDGTHTIKVVALDKAGNTATSEKQFKTGYYQEQVYRERTTIIWYTTATLIIGLIVGSLSPLIIKKIRREKS